MELGPFEKITFFPPDPLVELDNKLGAHCAMRYDSILIYGKDFLSKFSLTCMNKIQETKMTPPYAIQLENLTSDVGSIHNQQQKIDARHYNGYLIIPGVVYHLASKIQNSLLNKHFKNSLEVCLINFITRYGNYMQTNPHLRIHEAHSKYFEMTATYINECTGKAHIIPVTMYLVMLYNLCFVYQSDKKSNLLIAALDVFDLGATVDHDKLMNTMSECNHWQYIPIWNILFQYHTTNMSHHNYIVCILQLCYKMSSHGILLTQQISYQKPPLQKEKLRVLMIGAHSARIRN